MGFEFIKTVEDEHDNAEVVFNVHSEICVEDILVEFVRFLRACGYNVNEKDFKYEKSQQ
jgi:hypothetical protein